MWVIVVLLLLCRPLLVKTQRFNCAPPHDCIDRSGYHVTVLLYHGNNNNSSPSPSYYWQQVEHGMTQAARDMNITLYFENLYKYSPPAAAGQSSTTTVISPSVVANRIQLLYADPRRYTDALIVTINDNEEIKEAVETLMNRTSTAVFALNNGEAGGIEEEIADLTGLIGIDETKSGRIAGEYFIVDNTTTIQNGTLFVIAAAGEAADDSDARMQERLNGMQEALPETELLATTRARMAGQLAKSLEGCPYSFIQLASTAPLQATIDAMSMNQCSFETTKIGVFLEGTGERQFNELAYQALESGLLEFVVIPQQPHLQGAMLVVLASMYSTTGQSLSGSYLSGPRILGRQRQQHGSSSSSSNLRVTMTQQQQETTTRQQQQEHQACAMLGFPVCPYIMNTDIDSAISSLLEGEEQATVVASSCECTNRSQVVIAGVVHGHYKDTWWDKVYEAMKQAGRDFQIDLRLNRLPWKRTTEQLFADMSHQIATYCAQEVDGLFVSLPNELLAQTVKEHCIDRGVPVMSINAGGDLVTKYGLMHHAGQVEFMAGKLAGERLIAAGGTRGACLSHIRGHGGLIERCSGMKTAFEEATVDAEYLGTIDVPIDNATLYRLLVEEVYSDAGGWEGAGLLSTGSIQIPSILELHKQHPDALFGTFDIGAEVFAALDDGSCLFGIDQNAYLQGYLPIPLLTWLATTGEALADKHIHTGPRFVTASPTAEELACQNIMFKTCGSEEEPANSELDAGKDNGSPAGGGAPKSCSIQRAATSFAAFATLGFSSILVLL